MTLGITMTAQETLAEIVRHSQTLLSRFLAGFDDLNYTRQTEHLPNHVAWCLGHCAHTMNRAAGLIDGRSLPERDFGTEPGCVAAGKLYTEAIARESQPVAASDRYPSLARCTEIFAAACERLADAIAGVSDAKLDGLVDWGTTKLPLRMLVWRVAFHNGMHAGQIVDLRRALGLGRAVG
jgi:uncharacterized damage-inducible protein DinB